MVAAAGLDDTPLDLPSNAFTPPSSLCSPDRHTSHFFLYHTHRKYPPCPLRPPRTCINAPIARNPFLHEVGCPTMRSRARRRSEEQLREISLPNIGKVKFYLISMCPPTNESCTTQLHREFRRRISPPQILGIISAASSLIKWVCIVRGLLRSCCETFSSKITPDSGPVSHAPSALAATASSHISGSAGDGQWSLWSC